MKTVGSRQSAVGRKACSPEGGACAHSCPLPTAHCPRRRQAFTLVELLIAISIIAILATLLLGAAATAGETARDARTKSLVARLHTLLIEKFDSYRSARVEVKPIASNDSADLRAVLVNQFGFVLPTNLRPLNQGGDPRVVALARLGAQRELMRLEMPDRWSDVVGWNNGGATGFAVNATTPADSVALPLVTPNDLSARLWLLRDVPTLTTLYARQYSRMQKAGVTAGDARANEGAELLYLIIMNATADGEARGLFKQGDIGDTDGDGAPELLDGWGQPITFVRWAPGFESDAQLSAPGLNRLYDRSKQASAAGKREEVDRALRDDHDPFDLFSLDQPDLTNYTGSSNSVGPRGWRLMPLVVSPGGDGELGLELRTGTAMRLDPYFRFAGPTWVGQVLDPINDNPAADNVHSHRVGALSRKR